MVGGTDGGRAVRGCERGLLRTIVSSVAALRPNRPPAFLPSVPRDSPGFQRASHTATIYTHIQYIKESASRMTCNKKTKYECEGHRRAECGIYMRGRERSMWRDGLCVVLLAYCVEEYYVGDPRVGLGENCWLCATAKRVIFGLMCVSLLMR